MKALLFLMLVIICQSYSISSGSEESLEKVSLKIGYDAVIELSAKEIIAANRKDTYGMCIYQGQLWAPAMTDPPYKIMIAGYITIDDMKIELDVSGLATPWVNSSEMEKGDCRLKKHKIGENDHYYILDVCFFKGGALDYMVTWSIYKDKSRRENIIDVADEYPDWYKEEESEFKEQAQRQNVELEFENIKDIETYNKILDIESKNKNGFLPPELPYSLCKIGRNIAVLVRDGGSGLFLYDMYIIARRGRTWFRIKHSKYSTSNNVKSPNTVMLKNNVVTIIAKNGEVVDSFNASDYLTPCFQEERRGKCKKSAKAAEK